MRQALVGHFDHTATWTHQNPRRPLAGNAAAPLQSAEKSWARRTNRSFTRTYITDKNISHGAARTPRISAQWAGILENVLRPLHPPSLEVTSPVIVRTDHNSLDTRHSLTGPPGPSKLAQT